MTPSDSSDPDYVAAALLFGEIASLIGEVAILWASLDNELILLLARLAECPTWSAGVIFYALNSLNNQISIIKGLAKHNVSDSSIKDEILLELDQVRELSKVRNSFIHSVYKIVYDPKRRKRKWRVIKQTFRSESSVLVKEINAQTGEFTSHKRQVGDLKMAIQLRASSKNLAIASPSPKTQNKLLLASTGLATD